MTRDELADVRWLASEAVAHAVLDVHARDGRSVGRVAELAWALGAVGGEVEEWTPGTGQGADAHWPVELDRDACEVILAAAPGVEEMYLVRVCDYECSDGEAQHAFWRPRAERVRRARAVLERGLVS